MRASMTCFFLLAGAFAQTAQEPRSAANLVEARRLVVEASTALEAKDCAKAAGLYAQAVEAGATSSTTPYNVACCFALQSRADDAFKYLHLAVDKGWTNSDHLAADTDLESLRPDPRFDEVIARCKAKREEYRKSLGNPELYDELIRRRKLDQDARMADPIDLDALHRIDSDNTRWMKEVLDKHGWPGFSMVGKDGAQTAWLLIQHADREVPFQKRCLELLTAAVEKKEASPVDLAYLTDRVLMHEGKPQIYGTQFREIDGEMKPHPIEDEANVDARRAKIGLEPLAVYAKRMQPPEHK